MYKKKTKEMQVCILFKHVNSLEWQGNRVHEVGWKNPLYDNQTIP